MKKGKAKELFGELLQIADKNSPAVLTGLVCAGVVGTTLIAWFNAPKAKKVIEDYKRDLKNLEEDCIADSVCDSIDEIKNTVEQLKEVDDHYDKILEKYKEGKAELTAKMVLGTVKYVAPVVVMGGATIACAIGANTVSSKRIAALSAAYSLSEKALSEFQAKTTELIGEDKTKEVKAAIAADKVEANPPTGTTQIIYTGSGDVLCYDTFSSRYFKSNPEKIRQKVNELNYQLMNEYYISLNEFYNMLGLPNTKIGYDIGFCIDSGLVEMTFKYRGQEESEVPVLVLNYEVSPKYKASQSFGD